MIDCVAFYAPLKPPDHPSPSGDRRVARALMSVLARRAGRVELASRFRSYDRAGDRERQERLQHLGARFADRLITRYARMPASRRPQAWVTYHGYHKSPDWLGPAVRRALNIPYILIETSFAPKQAGGRWDLGHRSTEAAIRTADIVLAMTAVDEGGIAPLIEPPSALRRLPPFLDPTPYQRASGTRAEARRSLATRFGLDRERPWLLAVGMMRDDVKLRSYERLAEALRRIADRDWQLLIVGDGVSRPLIEEAFKSFGSKRVRYAGILEEHQLPACYAAADVYAWPALREAYGMALLEAQASSLPVVAGREGGVEDVVRDGVTGILVDPHDPEAIAAALRDFLDRPAKRRAMARAAATAVAKHHSLEGAADLLEGALADAAAIFETKRHDRLVTA